MEVAQPTRGHTNTLAPKGAGIGHGFCSCLRTVEKPAPDGKPASREVWPDAHVGVAVGALPGCALGGAGRAGVGGLRRCGEKLPSERQEGGSPGVCEEPELPDADEAPWQNMLSEAAEELRRFQSHLLMFVSMRVIFPAESDALSIEGQ